MLVTVVIISCTTTGGEGQTCFGTFFVLLTNLFNCCFYLMSATCKGGLEFRETCKGALTGALCVEAMGCKCIQARARLPTSSSSSASSSNIYNLELDYIYLHHHQMYTSQTTYNHSHLHHQDYSQHHHYQDLKTSSFATGLLQ